MMRGGALNPGSPNKNKSVNPGISWTGPVILSGVSGRPQKRALRKNPIDLKLKSEKRLEMNLLTECPD